MGPELLAPEGYCVLQVTAASDVWQSELLPSVLEVRWSMFSPILVSFKICLPFKYSLADCHSFMSGTILSLFTLANEWEVFGDQQQQLVGARTRLAQIRNHGPQSRTSVSLWDSFSSMLWTSLEWNCIFLVIDFPVLYSAAIGIVRPFLPLLRYKRWRSFAF